MTTLLIISQIVLAIILTISVLLQKSSSIGLGVYSGSNESLFGAKGPAGFMAKFTMVVGLIFIINTIALGYLYTSQRSSSILDKMDSSAATESNSADSAFDTTSPFGNSLTPTAPLAPTFPSENKN